MGGPDILVNNAGIHRRGLFMRMKDEDLGGEPPPVCWRFNLTRRPSDFPVPPSRG